MNVELAFGTPRHTDLFTAVRQRYDFSKQEMSKYTTAWDTADKMAHAYMRETQVDAARRLKRDQGYAEYTTIDIPMSYAMLLSAHTYWSNVFLSRTPVFQYAARHGESQQNVLAVEAVMDYQVQVGEMLVPLYIWLFDMAKYGRGIMGIYWDSQESIVSEIVEEPVMLFGLDTGKTRKKKKSRRVTGYQGNKLFNIRPQDFFPDPRYPLHRLQEMEFVGYYSEVSWNTVVKKGLNGEYFNIDALEKHRMSNNADRVAADPVTDQPQINNQLFKLDYAKDKVALVEMYITIIPADWKLGSSKYPEKWVFTMADSTMLIEARPMGAIHDKFPFVVQEYEIEGYDVAKRSMLEINKPLNDVITWLVNSHFYNVRKSLNNQFVVDQQKVNMADLTDPNPGKLIRLKPGVTGVDVRQVIQQLPTVDITRSNLQDMQLISEMLQRLNGVNDNIQGVQTPGGRKTATEIRASGGSGLGRLKTTAEFNSALGWGPLSQIMVQNTQQYYDDAKDFRIAGDIVQGRPFVNVTPDAIAGFYDFISVDGTMPIDKMAMAALWRDLLGQMRQIPPLMAQFDVSKIFSYVAQLTGLRNINQFRINVVPDGMAQQQMQEGNLVQLGGNDGAGLGTGGGAPDGSGGVPGAPNIAGVGPTG